MERKTHPAVLRRIIDEMFSFYVETEIEEMFSTPIETEVDKKNFNLEGYKIKDFFPDFSPEKYIGYHGVYEAEGKWFLRVLKKTDRRNPKELERTIKQRLDRYLKKHNDNTPALLLETSLEDIERYQNQLCPNWKRNFKEKELYYDLEAYKTALLNLIPFEASEKTEISELSKPAIPTFHFENNFDGTPRQQVYDYFYIKLVEKKTLSEKDLKEFLKASFEKKQIPEQLFILKDITKSRATKIFYGFFEIAGKPHGKQKKYAALLGDYFKGYDTKVISSNFSK